MKKIIESIEKLLEKYTKEANVLIPGNSDLSYQEMRNQAVFYKNKIQPAKNSKIDLALNAIVNKTPLDIKSKGWAKIELISKYNDLFTEAQIEQFKKLIDSYNHLIAFK